MGTDEMSIWRAGLMYRQLYMGGWVRIWVRDWAQAVSRSPGDRIAQLRYLWTNGYDIDIVDWIGIGV